MIQFTPIFTGRVSALPVLLVVDGVAFQLTTSADPPVLPVLYKTNVFIMVWEWEIISSVCCAFYAGPLYDPFVPVPLKNIACKFGGV